MYETEANFKSESASQLSPEALAEFADLRGKIVARTVLPWSEHCTECVWPTCYTTCDMYSPREDKRCRRFVDGMVRIDCPTAVNGYLLKIRFKQWGKLWTPGSLNLHVIKKADRIEARDYLVGKTLYQLPLPAPLKTVAISKRYGLKKRIAMHGDRNVSSDSPTSFLLECFNPMDQPIEISFSVRSFSTTQKIPFQKLIPVKPGYQLTRISIAEVLNVVNLSAPFNVELIPNEIGQDITLYFGLMDFVRELPAQAQKRNPIKCVVWDLDNTLWSGVLTEDSLDNLTLKPNILDIVKELDRRGILQSIASKNNHDDAMRALKQFDLEEFFLYPQISWAPKGDAVKAIARSLNIGTEALLFIDDSPFELQQVEETCSGVRTMHANHYSSLLQMEELLVPVTIESRHRRKMYRVEQERQESAESFKDDYRAFLKHCNIEMTICSLTDNNLERVHELTQRTNQMNFSGTRYDRDLLRKLMQDPSIDTYVISCVDRFGSYGIVGFGTVDNREPRLMDLMFSCRIQAKRVEHAFLSFILTRYIRSTGRDFHANYRKTPRNIPSGRVFEDMGMQEVGVSDGITSLLFQKNKEVLNDCIITLILTDSNSLALVRV